MRGRRQDSERRVGGLLVEARLGSEAQSSSAVRAAEHLRISG